MTKLHHIRWMSLMLCLAALGCGGAGTGGPADPADPTDPTVDSPEPVNPVKSADPVTVADPGHAGKPAADAGATPACDFEPVNQCASADDLGTLIADSGTAELTASGQGSHWFRFYLRETDFSAADLPLNFTITLTSPEGMNYDPSFVWDCGSTQPAETSANGPGLEDKTSGGVPDSAGKDSAFVWVHVSYVSGNACGPDDNWQLTIKRRI